MTADATSKAIWPALPASLDYAEINVRSTAKVFGTDMDDPGLLRWWANVTVHDFSGSLEDDENGPPLSEVEGIGLSIKPIENGDSSITIFRAEGCVVDLNRIEDAYETLVADSQELEGFGCLFDLQDNSGLHPDLEMKLAGAPFYSHVVILQRARVAPAWRGLGGVGRYLTARVLQWVCSNPAVIAAHPFPVDIERDNEGNINKEILAPALKQVRRTWKSIGFEPYKNDIWVLDPHTAKHERALAKLGRKLGLT